MSTVWRAQRENSAQIVAVKGSGNAAQARHARYVEREIEVLSTFRHPGVVRLTESGVDGDGPWYAMELLDGPSLRTHMRTLWARYSALRSHARDTATLSTSELTPVPRAPSPAQRANSELVPAAAGELKHVVQLVHTLAETLGALHEHGILHGDLKPDNVLLREGRPVLIDFGLSIKLEAPAGSAIADSPRVSGTPEYLAPERALGRPLTARSELYSMGCLFYELLVSHAPFTGASRTIVAHHIASAPVAPARLVRQLPRGLNALVLALLAKEPTDRPSVPDVLQELSRYL